ncbi:hypothetical protein NQ656_17540 [Acinetobacter baumannii]|nr:hypothetical protein [Acinetobacter baumannii]
MRADLLIALIVLIVVGTGVFFFAKSIEDGKELTLKKLNSENCKLVEIIQPKNIIDAQQYKYQCDKMIYTLSIDYSSKLNNK